MARRRNADRRPEPRDRPATGGSQDRRAPAPPGLVPLLALVLLVVGTWAYATSFRGVFVWDDQATLVENPHIRSLWPLSTAMGAPADSTLSARPVASLSFALNYAFAPADVRHIMKPGDPAGPPDAAGRFARNIWGYHATNLAIHLLAALTLFGIIRRTLRCGPLEARVGHAAPWLAFAVAVCWMVHPLQTQAITYVVQRVESLMGLFYLLTLYAAIRAGEPGRRQHWWTAAAIVACALGMGTKETMVTAPLMVGLWDWMFAPAGAWRGRRRLYAGLAATWIILVYLVSLGLRPAAGFTIDGWTPWSYLLTQSAVIVHYLRLTIVPHPLVFDYRWEAAASFQEVAPQVFILAAAVLATIVSCARRWPIGFAGAWFFLILGPTSSVLPIATEVAAEHRMYLPAAAVIAAIVTGAYAAGRRWLPSANVRRGIAGLLVGVVALVFAGLTRERNTLYWSDEALMADTVAKRPANAPARLAYGTALLTRQRFGEAEAQFRAILALPAGRHVTSHAHMLLGSSQCAQGRVQDGIVHLTQALALDPALTDAHALLAEAYESRGDLALAAREFEHAVRGTPDNPVLLRRVAWFLATVPRDDLRNGARAVVLGERARQLTAGQDPMTLEAIAAAYAEQNRFAEAAALLREALVLARPGGNGAFVSVLEQELAAVLAGQSLRAPSR